MSVPITVAYGDGVGPEIMEAVLLILKEAQTDITIETVEVGNAQYCRDWPCGIAPSAWASINRTKVLLKSPTMTPQGGGHKSLNVALRKRLGLYANVRPCVSYFPVINTSHPNLDIVVIRENEEDTYCGMEYRLSEDAYECVKLTTLTASERLCEYAFCYARNYQRKKVTCLVKDNIMKMTDGTLRHAFDKVAAKYPEIDAGYYIVDIGMAKIAAQPEEFDVVVTTNLYGDILSDIVSLASGSIGLSGSANVGGDYSMFEAVHGSAPDIAGKNIANPSGLLNAAVQMLVHLRQHEKAQAIHDAFLKTLEDGVHTADMYNSETSSCRASTTEFARAVANNLGATPRSLRRMSIMGHFSVGSTPAHNKDQQKRELVGLDVTVHWARDLPYLQELATSLSALVTSSSADLRLVHAKGMELWPSAPYAFSHIDLITCRFHFLESCSKDGSSPIGQLLTAIEGLGLDVAKVIKLYTYDGVPGFFST